MPALSAPIRLYAPKRHHHKRCPLSRVWVPRAAHVMGGGASRIPAAYGAAWCDGLVWATHRGPWQAATGVSAQRSSAKCPWGQVVLVQRHGRPWPRGLCRSPAHTEIHTHWAPSLGATWVVRRGRAGISTAGAHSLAAQVVAERGGAATQAVELVLEAISHADCVAIRWMRLEWSTFLRSPALAYVASQGRLSVQRFGH